MIKMFRAAAATTLALSAAAILAGCPSGGLPTGVTSPVPTGANGVTCDRESPAAAPDTATAAQGAYNGNKIPNGWAAAYKTEQEVTEAIKTKFEMGNQTDWACFQKFYAGTTSVYKAKTGTTAMATASPASN